jgi:hypothetical protein
LEDVQLPGGGVQEVLYYHISAMFDFEFWHSKVFTTFENQWHGHTTRLRGDYVRLSGRQDKIHIHSYIEEQILWMVVSDEDEN